MGRPRRGMMQINRPSRANRASLGFFSCRARLRTPKTASQDSKTPRASDGPEIRLQWMFASARESRTKPWAPPMTFWCGARVAWGR